MVVRTLVANVFLLVFAYAIRSVSSNDDDGYGTEWLSYYDEDGNANIMNFSVLPDGYEGWQNGHVYFNLYTRNNADDPETLEIPENDEPVQSQYFSGSRYIKSLTHGWLSNGNSDWIQNEKSAFLDKEDLNVIIVDWGELAMNPVYPWAVAATRFVGKRLAKLLDSLANTYNVTGDQMYLTGHSLGAQVMGYAGMFYNDTIFRITGLDPARPLFELPPMDDDCRLDASDAMFVDIIHTAAGTYGYQDSHGQADYYPNGGASQPGCHGTLRQMDSCSHGRAYEYFIESIEDGTPFTSYPCESYEAFENGECQTDSSSMGAPAETSAKGNYYLHTRNETPYAVGDEY